ncbi:MAG: Coenzyme PQQ synthesis protein E [Myxococcota bacterium]|nr:Coenzyme PQQ synthesis protein E [Myxococcota bacterium]
MSAATDLTPPIKKVRPGHHAAEAIRTGLPQVVHFSITDVCNISCKQCDIWAKKKGRELHLEEWKGIVDKLHDWLGPFVLKIAGGEPFVKKWLPDLIGHARSKNIFVGVSSNGILIDRPLAWKLLDIGLNEINLSLDSLRPEWHDYVRNYKGTFQRVMEAIRYFKEAPQGSIDVNLACIIHHQNLDELVDIAWWAKENKLRTVTYQPLLQNFAESYNPFWYKTSELWPRDYAKVCRTLDDLSAFRRKHWTVGNLPAQLNTMKYYFKNPDHEPVQPCTAGTNDAAVDPFGKFYLCFNLDSIGDLMVQTPEEAHTSHLANQRRAEISGCGRNCYLLNCVFAEDSEHMS